LTAKNKSLSYALVIGCYLIYSLSLVSAKFAAEHPLLSLQAVLFYGLSFFLLGVFAIAWQQVLKHVPLTIAYANRAVTVFFGMIWGALLFAEAITLNMILGSVIILIGVIVMVMKRG